MSKTILIFILIGALGAAALVEAWSLTQITDLQTTRSSICQVVDSNNANMAVTRARILSSAARSQKVADADRDVATRLSAFGANPALAALVKDFQTQAKIADETANELEVQASQVRPFRLAGC